ncbi:MAG: bifunctional cobalt-precorrin-7 (C(5))-methyltransferase/cobalt-precorrin-6B (C(15))-methyltransferase [Desulfobacterales bacterium]|nr:MAG: bifunctional cobalt-precorrin-7 (C(5))-methyltransferase/cobalt-precorrin-6B (C(15))-methyltransferase [Desulfobacterales bacterium]
MTVSIIGLGMSPEDLTARHLSLIQAADVLAGGIRHLAYFPDFAGERIEISKKLKEATARIRDRAESGKRVVVLASGDPLFFGIGAWLCRELPSGAVRVYPNISSVAAAFSRLRLSWHDARVISLHGRPLTGHALADFHEYDTLAVLTDRENTPARIIRRLTENGIAGFAVCVLSRLGEPDESVQWYAPGEAIDENTPDPNLMVFVREKTASRPRLYPGMPDAAFVHERGLITKPEARAVTLSKLMLHPGAVFWDLGAGSGSVSVEASLFIRSGTIHAVEQHSGRIRQIRKNRDRFGVAGMKIHHGDILSVMDRLPDPDRIFIGGGGKDLPAIIRKSGARLPDGGVMVINTVLLDSLSAGLGELENAGWETEIVQMQISRGHDMPWSRMLKAQNPLWIIRAEKQINSKERKSI